MQDFSIIKVAPQEHQDALTLIQELDTELLQKYPENSVHTLDLQKATPQNSVFLVGYKKEQAVACGAIYQLSDQTAEIKRVFVRPQARGQGLSKLLLNQLEQEAAKMGFKTLRLETGTRQPESIGLYRKAGYFNIPKFGEYIDDPFSICMEKKL
jgi:GNAT superfamily N-acetyltransferase